MKSIQIEFIARSEPPKWAWALCAVLALTALCAALYVGWEWTQLRQLRAEFAIAKALQVRATSIPPVLTNKPLPYDANARIALREAQFATASALTALEHVAMVGVTPIAVDLQADTGTVTVDVEFDDQSLLLAYLAALNEGDASRWSLLKARAGGPAAKGNATLQSHWGSIY